MMQAFIIKQDEARINLTENRTREGRCTFDSFPIKLILLLRVGTLYAWSCISLGLELQFKNSSLYRRKTIVRDTFVFFSKHFSNLVNIIHGKSLYESFWTLNLTNFSKINLYSIIILYECWVLSEIFYVYIWICHYFVKKKSAISND